MSTTAMQPTATVSGETTVEPGVSDAPARKKTRDPFFDNAKFLAIVLVVAGHAIEPLRDVPAAHALYLFLYMFHMPVFILIAGYFSKGFPSSSDKVRKLVTGLLVPFVIFQLAYVLYARLAGRDADLTLLDPYYLAWFLLALFAWRASTPLWKRVRWPVAIAVAISVLAGTQELVDSLSLGRILSLLPFFVVGLCLKPEHFQLLRRRAVRIAAVPVFAGGVAMAFWAHTRMSLDWIFWRNDNDYLAVDDLIGSAMRIGMLACAGLLVAAFLALVPAKHYWFSKLGSRTLYVYLLHGFVVKGAIYLGLLDSRWLHSLWGIALVATSGAVLALLLSANIVRRLTRWAVEPSMRWVFR
ncbi:acyltransferase family protein [Flindersiella endophytica]